MPVKGLKVQRAVGHRVGHICTRRHVAKLGQDEIGQRERDSLRREQVLLGEREETCHRQARTKLVAHLPDRVSPNSLGRYFIIGLLGTRMRL